MAGREKKQAELSCTQRLVKAIQALTKKLLSVARCARAICPKNARQVQKKQRLLVLR